MLDYDSYVGRIAIGRIFHGRVKVGDPIAIVKHKGRVIRGKVTKILTYEGLKRVEVDQAEAGEEGAEFGLDDAFSMGGEEGGEKAPRGRRAKARRKNKLRKNPGSMGMGMGMEMPGMGGSSSRYGGGRSSNSKRGR